MKHKRKINIVHRVTKKYMRINKKRTFTAFIGITFMVLLMTCVFVGKDTAIKYLEDLSAMKQGSWHASVYDITKDKMEQLQALDMVESVHASANLGLTDFSYSEDTERPYLNVKAYEKGCFDLYNIKLVKGRLPENSGEIVISYACVSDGAKLEIGDKIDAGYFNRTITGKQEDAEYTVFPFYELEINKGETVTPPQDFMYLGNDDDFQENKEYTGDSAVYTIVGFVEAPFFETNAAAAYTGITLLDDKLFAASDLLNVSMLFDLNYKNFDSMERHNAIKEIAGNSKVEFNNYLLTFSGNSSDATMNMLVNMMTVFFVVLIILASVLLIYNVFNMSFRERCRYLGMLLSVGATSRQKRSSIYYEAFSLLIPAIPIGIILGLGVVLGGMNLLKPFILKFMSFLGLEHTLPVTLVVSWRAIAVIIIISVLTVLVSAFLPAKRIGKIGAVESIRNGDNNKNKTYKMKNNSVKIFGAEGLLAGNTLKRQRRKKKSISLAVVIFMVILLVTAFGTGAIHRVADDKTRDGSAEIKLKENQGYISFSPDSMTEDMSEEEYENKRKGYDALKEELKEKPGILRVEERYDAIFFGNVNADVLSREYWDAYYAVMNEYYDGGLSLSEFETEYKPHAYNAVNVFAVSNEALRDIADKTGSDYEALVNPEMPSAIILNECSLSTDTHRVYGKTARRYRYYDVENVTDLKTGDHFAVKSYSPKERTDIPLDFQIAGVAKNEQVEDYLSVHEDMWIIISIDTAKELASALGYYHVGQAFSEGIIITVDKDDMDILEELKTFSDGDHEIFFADKDRLEMDMTMGQALVKIIDIMLVCFVLLTSVICLLNLGNSISGRMSDRRREFAVMKSIGMTMPQMRKMLLMECAGILAEGLIIALVISSVLMYFIKKTIISIFGNVALTLPVVLMIFAVLFTGAAVVIITMFSFGREKEQNLLESIRSESV